MKTQRFLKVAIATAGMLLMLHVALAAATIQMQSRRSASLCTSIKARAALAETMGTGKIVLAGGSGVRAGLSAKKISTAIDKDVLNFGLHAGLGAPLLLRATREVLEPGDSVILFLEYPMLFADQWNPVSVEYALGCDPQALLEVSWRRIGGALMAAGPWRLWDVVSYEMRGGVLPAQEPGSVYGDRPLETFPPLSASEIERVDLYGPERIGVDPESWGARAVAEFVDWAHERDIHVSASWPNTMWQPTYVDEPGFDIVRDFYEGLGVNFFDTPERGLYSREYFYDTQYHLGPAGIAKRTEDFIAEMVRSRKYNE